MATAGNQLCRSFAQPSGASIWLGPQQQAGLTHLCAETPVRVLVGPRSCGKTTLLRHFRHHIDEIIALDLGGPLVDAAGVLSTLLEAVALGVEGLAENEQRNLLAVFFRERKSLGTRIVLCVDDVSGIEPPAWEEILRVCSLESSRKPLVEIAVTGNEEEATRYPLRDLALDGRTSAVEAVRYLRSPADGDIQRYVAWQLKRIGSRASFSPAACKRMNELCEGRFAEVNRYCEELLTAPFAAGRTTTIDADEIDATSDRLRRLEIESAAPAEGEETLPPNRLVIEHQGTVQRILPLTGRLVIGRSDHCDLKLDGPQVSRNHVMIVPALDDTLTLVDLNSVHGTFVNGRRVRRQMLKTGDVIGFCRYRLTLVRVGESRDLEPLYSAGPEPPRPGPAPRRPPTGLGASTAGR